MYAAGSEDMDTLTFNTPILLRHLTYSEARKEPVLEVQLAKVLEGFEMDMGQVRRFLLNSYPLPYYVLKVHRAVHPPWLRLPGADQRRWS